MYRPAAFGALFLQTVLRADPQSQPPDATPEPVLLKSTARAVQLDVFVTDPSGRPVQGLQKNDFVVTDNGRPRDIRIFAAGIDSKQTELSASATPIVTAIVIDAAPRPDGLQNNSGIFASRAGRQDHRDIALWNALSAIDRMAPGQVTAIYAACPDLRIVQDYTSDPARLIASLKAFVIPPLPPVPHTAGKKQRQTIDSFVPPMLSALRDVVARMSGSSGRKSVVWISQAYGADLNINAVCGAADLTVNAFNDANVPLYAVDIRFSPTCEVPRRTGDGPRPGQSSIVNLTCSQPPDISDEWMDSLARAAGGRAFSGGKVTALHEYDAEGKLTWGQYRMERDRGGLVSDAIRFAADESRDAYQLGFYVPESELDGKVHTLTVTVTGKPKLALRYRMGYTASAVATAPESRVREEE